MARAVDAAAARALLEARLATVELACQSGLTVEPPAGLRDAIDAVISSRTQSIREALLGALLAKALDPAIDATMPYVDQGQHAFSGRTLDERVVNPFLRENEFPCSTGPFLSMFRRQARFDASYADKVSDKTAFAAMLRVVAAAETNPALATPLIDSVLEGFMRLRDAANIALSVLPQIAPDQCRTLIAELLSQPSGGRWPMVLAVGALRAFSATLSLSWQVDFQGINVADRATGAGGDITVRAAGSVAMALEITERALDAARVRTTYKTKIAKLAVADYYFLHGIAPPTDEAKEAARKLFGQGHDVVLMPCSEFLMSLLVLAGRAGRARFVAEVRDLLSEKSVPPTMKVGWNRAIAGLSAG